MLLEEKDKDKVWENLIYDCLIICSSYNTNRPCACAGHTSRVYADMVFQAAYAEAYLGEHQITVASLMQYNKNALYKFIGKGIRAVALISPYYQSETDFIEILKDVKDMNRNVPVLVGGAFFQSLAGSLGREEKEALYKRIGADVYLTGEEPLCALKDCLLRMRKTSGNFSHIRNVAFRLNASYLSDEYTESEEEKAVIHNPLNWYMYKLNLRDATVLDFERLASEQGIPQYLENLKGLLYYPQVRLVDLGRPGDLAAITEIARFLKMLNRPVQWCAELPIAEITIASAQELFESGCLLVCFDLALGEEKEENKRQVCRLQNTLKTLCQNKIATMCRIADEKAWSELVGGDIISFLRPEFYLIKEHRLPVTACPHGRNLSTDCQNVNIFSLAQMLRSGLGQEEIARIAAGENQEELSAKGR